MFVVTHATPAHSIVASDTDHLSTATILLDYHSTLGTLSETSRPNCKSERPSLFVYASTIVPSSLAFEASFLLAVSASQLVLVVLLFYLLLTVFVRTPDHIRIRINLSGESESYESTELFRSEVLLKEFFVHHITATKTFESVDSRKIELCDDCFPYTRLARDTFNRTINLDSIVRHFLEVADRAQELFFVHLFALLADKALVLLFSFRLKSNRAIQLE